MKRILVLIVGATVIFGLTWAGAPPSSSLKSGGTARKSVAVSGELRAVGPIMMPERFWIDPQRVVVQSGTQVVMPCDTSGDTVIDVAVEYKPGGWPAGADTKYLYWAVVSPYDSPAHEYAWLLAGNNLDTFVSMPGNPISSSKGGQTSDADLAFVENDRLGVFWREENSYSWLPDFDIDSAYGDSVFLRSSADGSSWTDRVGIWGVDGTTGFAGDGGFSCLSPSMVVDGFNYRLYLNAVDTDQTSFGVIGPYYVTATSSTGPFGIDTVAVTIIKANGDTMGVALSSGGEGTWHYRVQRQGGLWVMDLVTAQFGGSATSYWFCVSEDGQTFYTDSTAHMVPDGVGWDRSSIYPGAGFFAITEAGQLVRHLYYSGEAGSGSGNWKSGRTTIYFKQPIMMADTIIVGDDTLTTVSSFGGTSDSLGVDTDGNGTVDNYLYSSSSIGTLKKGANITFSVVGDVLTISGAAGGSGTSDSIGVDTNGDGTVDGYMYSTTAGAAHLRKGTGIVLVLAGDTVTILIDTVYATNTHAENYADSGIATHAAAADPHPGYLTPAEGNAAYAPITPDSTEIDTANIREWLADKIGEMLSGNTETNITVTYEDGDNTIDFVVSGAGGGDTALVLSEIMGGSDKIFWTGDTVKVVWSTGDTCKWYVGASGKPVLNCGGGFSEADSMMITETLCFTNGIGDTACFTFDLVDSIVTALGRFAAGGGSGTADSIGVDTNGDGTVDGYMYSTTAGAAHLKKGTGITITLDTDTAIFAVDLGTGATQAAYGNHTHDSTGYVDDAIVLGAGNDTVSIYFNLPTTFDFAVVARSLGLAEGDTTLAFLFGGSPVMTLFPGHGRLGQTGTYWEAYDLRPTIFRIGGEAFTDLTGSGLARDANSNLVVRPGTGIDTSGGTINASLGTSIEGGEIADSGVTVGKIDHSDAEDNWLDPAFVNESGDTLTGRYDLNGAELVIPSGANPTTDADGELAFDNDEEALEIYDGAASRLIPSLQRAQFTVVTPDAVADTIMVLSVPATYAPGGIKIVDIELRTADSTGTYVVIFEEWTGKQNPTKANEIDTLTVNNDSTWVRSATAPEDPDIAADNYVYAIIPATTGQSWISGTIVYYIKENN